MKSFDASTVLAIDCATSEMKLGLQYGADKLVTSGTNVERSHGQMILREIAQLFLTTGVTVEQLEAIVVGTGPGSFTGLRIALAAAKGMAVSLSIPVVGVNLFEIAASRYSQYDASVTVVVPFKRDSVFVGKVVNGRFDNHSISSVKTENLSEICNKQQIVGIGADVEKLLTDLDADLDATTTTYSGGELIRIGIKKLAEGKVPSLAELEPLYVQKSQAELKFEQIKSNQRD